MSNEASIQVGLRISKNDANGVLTYASIGPNGFTANVTGTKGPVPGAITASIYGTDVDFSQLTVPSWCEVYCMGPRYGFDLGIFDPNPGRFYPMMTLYPGEKTVFRISDLLGEYPGGSGSGTGTIDSDAVRIRARGRGGAALAYIGAFEK
jgi:hypothetical protein